MQTKTLWLTIKTPKVLKERLEMRPPENGLNLIEIEDKSRRGLHRYSENPFLSKAAANMRHGIKRITDKSGHNSMIVSGEGEVIAPAGFHQIIDVDKTQFVKLFVNGVKALKELSGAGTKVFELLYLKVQENISNDVIYISLSEIDQQVTPMSKATYLKGMKELILKDFIAESLTQNKYFLNPDFMWNGDRLAFVKEYRKVKAIKKNEADTRTLDLFDKS